MRMRTWVFAVAAFLCVLMLRHVDVISDSDMEEDLARVSADPTAVFKDHISSSDDEPQQTYPEVSVVDTAKSSLPSVSSAANLSKRNKTSTILCGRSVQCA